MKNKVISLLLLDQLFFLKTSLTNSNILGEAALIFID